MVQHREPKAGEYDLVEVCKIAAELAEIANDWDLGTNGEVEISGEWIAVSELRLMFLNAADEAEAIAKE